MSDNSNTKLAKQKLDELLGISSSESIDDFMKDLSTDSDKAKEAADVLDKEIKDKAKDIDLELEKCKDISLDIEQKDLSLANIKSGLKSIDDLIETSKVIVTQIYQNIIQTDIIDSELIRSGAAFIAAEHLLIKEYIDLYKTRMRFYEKMQLEILAQKHRLELLREKHKFELEKIASKSIDGTVDGSGDMVRYNFDDFQKILNEEK